MLDAARKAVSLVAGKSRPEVAADELARLALARLLKIVGEAAGKVRPIETGGSLALVGSRLATMLGCHF